MKQIEQGAEAKIYVDENKVVKDRFKKKYRHPLIDEKLSKPLEIPKPRVTKKQAIKEKQLSKKGLMLEKQSRAIDKGMVTLRYPEEKHAKKDFLDIQIKGLEKELSKLRKKKK